MVLVSPLISVDDLAARPDDPSIRIVDCRWYLGRPGDGRTGFDLDHQVIYELHVRGFSMTNPAVNVTHNSVHVQGFTDWMQSTYYSNTFNFANYLPSLRLQWRNLRLRTVAE